ncbi:sensor histidine kinase [Streptococcus macedonicus]|uniref:sensor histidine kinase n=1 Tax=Streptococcus macedonicus TaxID=59310 RepID=UPI001E61E682|nr:histidine kinase [Streptococcus macedonicus]
MTALYGLCVLGFGLLQDGLDFFNFILLAEAVAMIALLSIYYYQMIYRQAFQAQYLQEVNEELNQAYAQVEEVTTKAVKQTLARDLHDSLTQDLIGINMHLSAMKVLLDNEDYQKLAQTLEKKQHFTKESISEARQTIADYRQEKRENLTLQWREELQKRLTNLQENYHLNTQLAMPDEIESSYHQGMDVLRMINEALMNVIKHAEIDQAKVDVKKEVKMLQIHVINFGKLMRLLAQNNQHFGLLDMKE